MRGLAMDAMAHCRRKPGGTQSKERNFACGAAPKLEV
jgi:hypothetical protein